MKYLILIVSAFILVGCNTGEQEAEKPVTEKTDDTTEQEDHVVGSFRNGDIIYGKNHVRIEGSAKATDDKFYYQVEQGESVLVKETQVKLDETEDGWGEFVIELDLTDEMAEHEELPILVLYVKDNNNTKVNPSNMPIDLNLSQY